MEEELMDKGASATPTGLSQAEPEVSALRASIPSATVPCVACGRELESAIPGTRENQPYAGTAFATRGHYGSAVFDPMDDSALEINVCDECLLRAGVAGRVLHHGYHGPHRKRVVSWSRAAQAIEARRAETGTGSVHESAVPEGNAPEHHPPQTPTGDNV